MKRRSRRNKIEHPKERESFFKNTPESGHSFFDSTQPKLDVGSANDPHEKQADAVASKVVSSPTTKDTTLQRETDQTIVQSQGKEEEMQTKLQRQEEEELQTKLQKQEEEEEVQAKLQRQEEEEMQTKLQRQDQEEKMQTKLQRQEEEESIQTKIQRKSHSENSTSKHFESRLAASKSGGNQLPKDILEEMELKMKTSFTKVRIHTDANAQWLCEKIHAQAFTSGNHIYFNKGKFQPGTKEGRFLLAHELTHVIQQRGTV